MKVKSIAKYQRVSQRKVDRIMDLVRGKDAVEASTILNFLPHASAKLILNALKSAIANAVNNYKLPKDSLVVAECYAGPSTPMKRFRPSSRGRAHSIMKRACHITVVVEDR